MRTLTISSYSKMNLGVFYNRNICVSEHYFAFDVNALRLAVSRLIISYPIRPFPIILYKRHKDHTLNSSITVITLRDPRDKKAYRFFQFFLLLSRISSHPPKPCGTSKPSMNGTCIADSRKVLNDWIQNGYIRPSVCHIQQSFLLPLLAS